MKINQLKAGAILSYISMGIGYIISIIYTPIMLRLLGQSEFGLYNLVASVVSYLGVLNFGFGSAYMRYYSRYKAIRDSKEIATLNGMFLVIFTVLGFITVIAGVILALYSTQIFGTKLSIDELAKAKILILILVVNLAFSFPNIVFDSYITANENFIFQKILGIVRNVINPFAILPILIMGYGSIGMVITTTILNILIEFINIFFCIKKLKMKFSFKKFDLSLMKEMSVFSFYIFLNLIIDQINWNVDKFILGRFRGTMAVAIYGLAAQLNTYYLSISTSISNVFVPRVHKIVSTSNNDNELTDLFSKIGRIQFIILSLIITGYIYLGKPFINIWAGENYNDSYYIALLLMITVTIPLIQNIGIEILRARNKHKFRSLLYLFMAIFNVLVTIPLVKVYGGIGAAMGTGLSLSIGNGLIMNFYYSKVGLKMWNFWKEILKIIPSLIIPIITGIIISHFVNLYIISNFLIFGFLYVIVYCLSILFLGFNTYEKNIIVKPVLKILKKGI